MATPQYVCIEGGMGAGKTTLAQHLAVALSGNALLEETAGHPFIREFYSAPDVHALETELAFILIHYHQVLREHRRGTFERPVVCDFSFERDYVFAALTLKQEEDRRLFSTVYSTLTARVRQPDLLVYLRADPGFLARRMALRGRDYERGVGRDYLEAVVSALDRFFVNEYGGRKVVLNAADLDSSHNPRFIGTVIEALQSVVR